MAEARTATVAGSESAGEHWDTSYEWQSVTLLGLGFGLVGLDRWIISPLFPFMTDDLGLNYQDLGNVVGVLGLMWGFFAIFSGRLSDRIGHRKVLIPAIMLFSVLSGLTGLVAGFASLIAIRALMGVTEGTYCPTSFTAVAAASRPSRRGFNQGLQQCGFALLGLGLGPIIATQLLAVVPSWRWVFWIVAIPGFIVGLLLWGVLREPRDTQGGSLIGAGERGGNWFEVLKSRNIVLSMLALFGAMSCVFVLSAMIPNYLIDYLKLTAGQMGVVTSAIGFGGFFGQFGVPGLSDLYGRKLVALAGFAGAAASVWWFARLGATPGTLFAALFAVSFFCLGNVALLTGPIATEAAPMGLISSAIGIVVGSGEIFGGGVAPSIAGFIAQHFGIQNVMFVALTGVVFGFLVCLLLTETAPRKVAIEETGPIA